MAVNKVIYSGKTIIDISDSTVTPNSLDEGVIAYSKSGEKIVGTRNNKFSFSTTEQWTGNYWIDGKKIYYKAIQLDTSDIFKYPFSYQVTYKSHLFIEFNPTNLKDVIFVRGMINDDNEYIDVSYVRGQGFMIDLLKKSVNSGWIFICYTKTTD
jgi:hypothetical protein